MNSFLNAATDFIKSVILCKVKNEGVRAAVIHGAEFIKNVAAEDIDDDNIFWEHASKYILNTTRDCLQAGANAEKDGSITKLALSHAAKFLKDIPDRRKKHVEVKHVKVKHVEEKHVEEKHVEEKHVEEKHASARNTWKRNKWRRNKWKRNTWKRNGSRQETRGRNTSGGETRGRETGVGEIHVGEIHVEEIHVEEIHVKEKHVEEKQVEEKRESARNTWKKNKRRRNKRKRNGSRQETRGGDTSGGETCGRETGVGKKQVEEIQVEEKHVEETQVEEKHVEETQVEEKHVEETILGIILLGDSGVGKTSIFYKCYYSDENEIPEPTRQPTTCFQQVHSPERGNMLLQILDTIGANCCTLFVRFWRSDGIMLVYDVTDRESFDYVEDLLRIIDETARYPPIMCVVGNKIDMRETGNKNHVTTEEGRKFAQQHNLTFFETSIHDRYSVLRAYLYLVQAISSTKRGVTGF